ncbi:MAG: lysozyme family protein [Bacillota bacterium]|nr:lysozyme family protein [Bacillota bacterium]
MADIKLREVNRGTIKIIDHSIASSNRIRNATSEIKTQSRRQLETDEDSPNEYASGQIEYGMQESAYIARHAAAKAAPKIKDGTQKAIQSYRIRHARSQIKRQRVNSSGADSASESSIKLKQLAQTKAKSNQVAAARQTQKQMQQTAMRTAEAAKQSVKTTKQVVKSMLRAARAAVEGTKALITAIFAVGWAAVAVVLCCVIFGTAFYFFGDDSSSYEPVSPEVEAYTPLIQKYANEYGIPQYTELIKAVMMQESGGRGKDPMQASECGYNKKYPKKPNGIKDPEYSINCGVHYLSDNLSAAKAKSPVDMDRIKLALQGYNYGSGYIPWAMKKYGGYSYSGAVEFSKQQAKKNGWSSYGDPDYVEHVLRYYPYGNYSYDVINTGPGKLGLPIKGMKRGNISSHFGPRSSPGGIGSTYHQGLDIAFPMGTKVLACEAGTVVSAGWNGGLGKCIIIDHGGKLQTVYGHLSQISVKSGQKVVRGQYIGNVGSTGQSTGPHLHLGVKMNGKYVNPEKGWLSIP